MYKPMQLQNRDNTKKSDTGQLHEDYFTFREENASAKQKKINTRKKISM